VESEVGLATDGLDDVVIIFKTNGENLTLRGKVVGSTVN